MSAIELLLQGNIGTIHFEENDLWLPHIRINRMQDIEQYRPKKETTEQRHASTDII